MLLCHVWNTHIINVDVMSLKCWCHQCRYHVWNTHIININVISEKHWCHKCISHVWKRHPLKLVMKYLWHSCFSDMTSPLMTSVYFTWYQMKTISSTDGWRRRRTHSIMSVTFLQLAKKKCWQLFYFGITELDNTICPSHLVAGT
jgi:hypothetical protein